MASLPHFSKPNSSSIILTRDVVTTVGNLEIWGLPWALLRVWSKEASIEVCCMSLCAAGLENCPQTPLGCQLPPLVGSQPSRIPYGVCFRTKIGAVTTMFLVPGAPVSSLIPIFFFFWPTLNNFQRKIPSFCIIIKISIYRLQNMF